MNKVGICGNFNNDSNVLCGQTVKTRMIYNELERVYGNGEVEFIDTNNWRGNPVKLFMNCIMLVIRCENIIILPAQNGIKIFIPLFTILTKLLGRKLHYFVIGAWLPDELKKSRLLLNLSKKIDFIQVETSTLRKKLEEVGIKNIDIIPNFKSIDPIKSSNLGYEYNTPYKLCTFSRVNYQKGIEDAINAISKINNENKEKLVHLDIYGPIEEEYKDRFFKLMNQHDSFVTYKGIVDFDKSVNVLKNYYLLLFPTKYFTEGIPGTIIDAFLSGVPILASRWGSCYDIIEEGITGITYEFNNDNDLYKKLNYAINHKNEILEMKKNCLVEGKKYTAKYNIKKVVKNL
jgi:glycosyltransferase involved in cell wall biosynthesis